MYFNVKMKGRYPWRIGATSFVLPADVSENIDFLAERVDDIQLLFFESASKAALPHKVNISHLKNVASEHNLTYTVHLPTDLSLGSSKQVCRDEAVEEILRLMEELSPLSPQAFDLHLNQEQEAGNAPWLANLHESFSRLGNELGEDRSLIAVENIDYSFSTVRPLVLEHGFSICLDIGHALRDGEDVNRLIRDIPFASHIHYHGVEEDRDHQGISSSQEKLSRNLGAAMAVEEFCGVLTVEVYNQEALDNSLKELSGVWKEFEHPA
jgi:sugar phosphate isomerase/epimerase